MLNEIASKIVHKVEEGKRSKKEGSGKRSNTMNEGNPVENIDQNPEQKELLPSHKLQDHI